MKNILLRIIYTWTKNTVLYKILDSSIISIRYFKFQGKPFPGEFKMYSYLLFSRENYRNLGVLRYQVSVIISMFIFYPIFFGWCWIHCYLDIIYVPLLGTDFSEWVWAVVAARAQCELVFPKGVGRALDRKVKRKLVYLRATCS